MYSRNSFIHILPARFPLSTLLGFILLSIPLWSYGGQSASICPDSLPPYFAPDATDFDEPCGGGDDQVNLTGWILNRAGAIPQDSCSTAAWLDFDFLTSDGSFASNISFDSIQQYPMIPAGDCNWSVQVFFRATDPLGNQAVTNAIFSLSDNENPVLVGVPANVAVNCDAIPPPPLLYADINAIDNCDTSVLIIFSSSSTQTNTGNCSDFNYSITRNWTARDDCGNESSASQVIQVIDIFPPSFTGPEDITISCEESILPARTGGVRNSSDNCDPQPDTLYSDIFSAGNCINNYTITRIWTMRDECGNTSPAWLQTINVRDTISPSFLQEAMDENFSCATPVEAEQAFQNWLNRYGDAQASDGCSPGSELIWYAAVPGSYQLSNPLSIVSPGSLDAPQCPALEMGVYQSETVDFIVYDECGNAAVSTASFRVIDDVAPVFEVCPVDTLIPNISGTCEALFDLPIPQFSEACGTSGFLQLEYTINQGTRRSWNLPNPITETLAGGRNDIRYYAIDCAGNEGECQFWVEVEDEDPPVVNCPADIIRLLTPDEDCNSGVSIQLPFIDSAIDNCAFAAFQQTQPTTVDASLLSFSYRNDYMDYFADDKSYTFIGTAANAVGEPIELEISLAGDVEAAEAYYSIFDEEGNLLGTTENGQTHVVLVPGDCMSNPIRPALITARFEIAPADFNRWAADGAVTFSAISNLSFAAPAPGLGGEGINPLCTPFAPGTPDGTTDGLSSMTMNLRYGQTTPSYFITGATSLPLTNMVPPVIAPTATFLLGQSTVTYLLTDAAGNVDSCQFTVSVEDQIAPEPICQPDTIFIHPSGLIPYVLQPAEVDGGSRDNCMLDSLYTDRDSFDCSLLGSVIDVALIAVDHSGNSAQCTTNVTLAAQPPQPAYSIGLCGNDTLYLSANPPAPPAGFDYTYSWTGPQGFTSGQANPFIPNATAINSGYYSLVISGVNGCTATDSVEVIINAVPDIPSLQASALNACENDELILTTQQYTGDTVSYYWYSGTFPGGMIIDTTQVPSLLILPPLASQTYYVMVEVDGCLSVASPEVTVNITVAPNAQTTTPFIDLCQGENIVLGTPTVGAGYTYSWVGPDGFMSSMQNPQPFEAVSLNQSGTYTLVVSANGCASQEVQTVVLVRPLPAQPLLSSSGLSCEGGTVTLIASPVGADVYTWTAPDMSTQITTANSLLLDNVTTAVAGLWTVSISEGGCPSETSEPVTIFVEPLPVVMATNNGPGCEGGMVELSVNTIPGGSYHWTGPDGFDENGQTVMAAAIAGTYTVEVVSSLGCVNQSTTVVSVNELPKITALSSTAAACTNEADTIRLIPTLFPPDDGSYTYAWTGPGGFGSVDSIPLLTGINSTANGSYVLEVTNAAGCISLPDSIPLELNDAPARPMINGAALVCEGQTINLNTSLYSGQSVTYEWNTPLGILTTTLPELQITSATGANSGIYTVIVHADACASSVSDTLNVQVNSSLPLPVVSSNSPVCEGEIIELFTDSIPGATYIWTTPNNQMLIGDRPSIASATVGDAGLYSVQLLINGCSSPNSLPVNVVVNEQPMEPSLSNNGPVCIDEAGAVLLLNILPQSAVNGASYTWFAAPSDLQVGGPSPSTQLSLNNFDNYGEGIFEFYAIATLNGCRSERSVSTPVVMNEIPNQIAFAGLDTAVCDLNTITLDANAPAIGTGMWVQTSGPMVTIENADRADTRLFDLPLDTLIQMQWVLSSGVCENYSEDELLITLHSSTQMAEAGEDIDLCNQDTASLTALEATGLNEGFWSQEAGQAAMGVQIENPQFHLSKVEGLIPGNTYRFRWNLWNEACDTFATDTVLVRVMEDTEVADAGDDFSDCGNGSLFLMANIPNAGTGSWSTPHSELSFSDLNDPDTEVQGLSRGSYTFFWTLDKGDCGQTMDTVVVEYEDAPLAVDDEVEVSFARTATFDVLPNDDLTASGAIVVLVDAPANGNLRNSGDGNFIYDPNPVFAGIDSFHYQLCSQICPEVCSEARVILRVGEDEECFAPTIFTPNGDQFNDAFVVPCLATGEFPNNRLQVFNQWGDKVYEAAPYQNDWEGTYNGEELPNGSYYYVLKLGNGNMPISNFLVIER